MTNILRSRRIQILSTLLFSLLSFTSAQAGDISPDLQTKLNIFKAVMEANNNKASMSNQTWKSLAASDPKVKPFLTNTAGKKLFSWEKDKALGKLLLRDKNGNLVAGSKKPAIFNIADRPAFTKAIRGKIWNSKKVKADPTTKLSSIQLSIPVKNNGKEIGILHTSIIAN